MPLHLTSERDFQKKYWVANKRGLTKEVQQ